MVASDTQGLRIGLTADGLRGWQGGREFFQLVYNCLSEAREPDDEIYVLSHEAGHNPIVRSARAVKRLVAGTAQAPDVILQARNGARELARELLGEARVRVRASPPAAGPGSGAILDVAGPISLATQNRWKVPAVGYIPDLQHRRLPDFFSAAERADRDENFQALLGQVAVVIVNARAAKADIEQAYDTRGRQIIALPMCPIPDPAWLGPLTGVRSRYGLERPYFICSNQFWKHKNHIVVLQALDILSRQGEPQSCVFTGATDDYRHPDHFADLMRFVEARGLTEQVRFLGLIPKADQIELARGAIAMVQPTLFEGGPGGGCIFDAISLGLPGIVSDIPVNREAPPETLTFFDPHSAEALASVMRQFSAREPRVEPSAQSLLDAGARRRQACGAVLRKAFLAAALAGLPTRETVAST